MALTLLLAWFSGTAASQETGFDAHGFRLAGYDANPRSNLTLQRPSDREQGNWSLGGVLEYANRPLAFRDDLGEPVGVLTNLLAIDLSAGVVAHERLHLDVFAPIYATTSGQAGGGGAAFGDLRLTALAPVLLPSEMDGLGVGVYAFLDAPTGVQSRFLGQPGLSGGLGVAGTYERDEATGTVNIGFRGAPNTAPDERPAATLGGDAIVLGAGATYLVDPSTSVGLELNTDIELDPEVLAAVGLGSEALAVLRRAQPNGAHLTAGLGVGIGGAVTPVRIVVGGGFGSDTSVNADGDGDGILDRDDTCPLEAETVNGFQDAEGCPDELPKVVLQAMKGGVLRADASIQVVANGVTVEGSSPFELRGLPGDSFAASASVGGCHAGEVSGSLSEVHQDVEIELQALTGSVALSLQVPEDAELGSVQVRYVNAEARCSPESPLAMDGPQATHIVPIGTVAVHVLADGFKPYETTIDVQGTAVSEVTVPLVASRVKVTESAITITEKVHFETGKAVILAKSHPLLGDVAAVILAHDVKRIEVQGHTDSQGPEASNQRLSEERANSVLAFLVEAGVPKERLTAVGFGEAKPVADNKTAGGRSRNRRVEFKILRDEGAVPNTP